MPRKRSAAKPTEAFLSHSSKNLAIASRLAKVLSARQVKTFFSKKHIQGAQQWHDEIGAALKRCDWFLVILTPQSVSSKWVKHELIYALQANRYKGRIVPLLCKTCDADKLSWTLSSFEWIDFRKDFHQGCRDLFAIWRMNYNG
ncbi:MAG: toll/interleukin-1 receptor domain-containing protein [Nitrospiraceae bacterium]